MQRPAVQQTDMTDDIAEHHQSLQLQKLLAVSLRAWQSGDLRRAKTLYETILRIDASHAEAWHLLGLLKNERGETDTAAEMIRRAIELQSGNARYHYNLGVVLQGMGELRAAADQYKHAIQLKPRLTEAVVNLCTILLKQGDDDNAIKTLKEALAVHPESSRLKRQMGKVYAYRGNSEKAIHCFREALECVPNDWETRAYLGNVLLGDGRIHEAIAVYKKVIDINPDSAETLVNLGNAHLNIGRLEEAHGYYSAALEKHPGYANAVVGLVSVDERRGDLDKAYKTLVSVLKEHPDNINAVIAFSQVARQLRRHHEAVDCLSSICQEGLPQRERLRLCFHLGEIYDDMGEYDKALKQIDQGNAFSVKSFDMQRYDRWIRDIKAVFSREFIADCSRSNIGSCRPVFIVGMPRSGTSLVEHILSAHTDVIAAGERNDLESILHEQLQRSSYLNHGYPQVMGMLDSQALDDMALSYLNRVEEFGTEALRVTNKMPGNFAYLGLIYMLFPRATVINCSRNVLDVCLSCYFQNFSTGHDYSYDIDQLAEYYKLYNLLMEHWRSVLPMKVIDVSYEGLVIDYASTARNLVSELGLNWDDRCSNFYKQRRLSKTASYDQVRRPIYSDSIGRYSHYIPFVKRITRILSSSSKTI